MNSRSLDALPTFLSLDLQHRERWQARVRAQETRGAQLHGRHASALPFAVSSNPHTNF